MLIRRLVGVRHALARALLVLVIVLLRVDTSAALDRVKRAIVSSKGADALTCGGSSAPCRTLQFTLDNIVSPGGEIAIADPGGYGSAAISFSVKIVSVAGAGATIEQENIGQNAIMINARSTDIVTLQGLQIRGWGKGANGVLLNSAAALNILNCAIDGFTGAGIRLSPNSGALNFYASGVTSTANLVAGLLVQPLSWASVNGTAKNLEVVNNGFGVYAGGVGTGPISLAIIDSVASSNATGVAAEGTRTSVSAIRVVSSGNRNGFSATKGAAFTVVQSVNTGNTDVGVLTDEGTSRFFAGDDSRIYANRKDVVGAISHPPIAPVTLATSAAAAGPPRAASVGATPAAPAAASTVTTGVVRPRNGVDQDIFAMTDTWTNPATTYSAIKLDVTDTGSRYNTNLLDIGVVGTRRAQIRKDGDLVIMNSAGTSFGGIGLRGNAGEMAMTSQVDPNTGKPADVFRFYWENNKVGNVPGSAAVIRGMGTNRLSIESNSTLVHIANSARFEWEGLGGTERLKFVGYEAGSSIGRPIDFNNSGQAPTIATPFSASTVNSTVDIAKFGLFDGSSTWTTLARFSGSGAPTFSPQSTVTPAQPLINILATDGSTKFQVTAEGRVSATDLSLSALPTSDPHVAGKLWNSGGQLMVSGG